MKKLKNFTLCFRYDKEAEVWTVTSNEVPGLVLEADTYIKLLDRLKMAIPELLELNHAQ